MPWCSNGSIIDSSVDSCPPCRLEVEVKTAAGLPIRAPLSQSRLVVSMKYFIGAAMLPKRVGLPRISPQQSVRSASLT